MSTNKNSTSTKKAVTSITREELTALGVPVNDTIQEGQNLHNWAKHDQPQLCAAGLDIEKIDELAKAADFLRCAEGVWYNTKSIQTGNAEISEAMEFSNKLIHDYLYAYRDNATVLSAVRELAEASSNADRIQSLQNCREIGLEHPEELQAINFDMKLLDKAAAIADSVAERIGETKADDVEEKFLRDQAYTYLTRLISEVRECGKYVFYRDPARYKGYISHYHKRLRRKSKLSGSEDKAYSEVA